MKKFTFLLLISVLSTLVFFVSCEDSPVELPLSGCISGWEDCNDNMSDGCETDITSDESHCGGCGIPCPDDENCVDGDCVSACIDNDVDGYGEGCPMGFDCDDTDRFINPGADEVCDGVDNDCDGSVDELLVYSGTTPDHSYAICRDGMWQFDCESGYYDANSNMDDGCESTTP